MVQIRQPILDSSEEGSGEREEGASNAGESEEGSAQDLEPPIFGGSMS